MAIYGAGAVLLRYWHPDEMGNIRLASNPTSGFYGDMAFAPYGDTYAASSTPAGIFAGLPADTSGSLDDAMFREFDTTQGRWLSPDPAGLAAVDDTNPQSFNRYAYVGNNPATLVDPSGLKPCIGPPPCVTANFGNQPQGFNFFPNLAAWQSIDVRLGTVFVEGWPVGGPLLGSAFSIFGNFGTPVSLCYSALGTCKDPVPTPVVPANPCLYQGKALPPSAYVAQGQQANGSKTDFALDVLMGWPKGGYLDAQPQASGNKAQEAAYANYVYGVYMQAAGLTLSEALFDANLYSFFRSSYPSETTMDSRYASLPTANVANITNGFNAQQNGTTCHN